jgi:ribosomal protein L11 methyltransferase
VTVKNFVEVSLKIMVDSGDLIATLQDGEALGSWEKDGVLHIYWAEEQWQPGVLEDLERALERLGVGIGEVSLTVNSIPDRDWNAAWVAGLRPIRIGRRVRIRQSWHTADPAFSGIELVIDPKRAFGSGYHATTQLVIEWLEGHVQDGSRVLDLGTGSGILAMTAIRLGAAFALGIDNDPMALECARELSSLNGFGPELELRTASFDQVGAGDFDVVLANLDGKTLPLLCPFLPTLMRAEGLACLSGLQHQDLGQIAEALRKANLKINSRTEREDWLALEVEKAENATDSTDA